MAIEISGTKIKNQRTQLKKSKEELAIVADMSAEWITMVEKKESFGMNKNIAAAVAKALNVTIKDIEVN
jgi:transcriptional regulator with XRE-family HTH domain